MQQIKVPEQNPTDQVSELTELINGDQGRDLQEFAFKFQKLRKQAVRNSFQSENFWKTLEQYVQSNPYYYKKKDILQKFKTNTQYIYEENVLQYYQNYPTITEPIQ